MSSLELLDAIGMRLAGDETFLSFANLDLSATDEQLMEYIQKGSETDGVVTSETIPIVLLFTRPGHAEGTTTHVYNAKAVVACYSTTAYNALCMADRVEKILHNWRPDGFVNWGIYKANDTEFATGIPGIRGHRVVFDCKTFMDGVS